MQVTVRLDCGSSQRYERNIQEGEQCRRQRCAATKSLWCVRSGGTQYRIMSADGVALEVDVDEERLTSLKMTAPSLG